MDGRVEEIRDDLKRLMLEQLESLKVQTFGGLTEEELQQQKERLKRIREVSVDFLVACRSEFVTADAAGGVGVLPLDGPGVGGVGVDIAAELAS